MKVERIDLYDFKVVLTEAEFIAVKQLADIHSRSLDCTLLWIIGLGFDEVGVD